MMKKYSVIILFILLLCNLFCYDLTNTFAQGCNADSSEVLESIIKQDRRECTRFSVKNSKIPMNIRVSDIDINNGLDISRGGISFRSNVFKKGEILPLNIRYKNVDINLKMQIVSVQKNRTGAKFIVDNKKTLNDLLYFSILLESDNGYLLTKLAN